MYVKPLIVFSLFLLMLFASINPVKFEPALLMTPVTEGNAIKNLDLNLNKEEIAISFLELVSGEATLIQNSVGKNVLINTGSPIAKSQFLQQMKLFQVKKIDALVITNIGRQYTGNLAWLLENVDVGKIYIAKKIRNEFIQQFDLSSKNVIALEKDDQFTFLDKVQFEVAYVEPRETFNEGGLALIVKYGNHQFLYMGVASEEADNTLIKRGPLDIELIKVGAFGHYFGTSEQLLNHVNPHVAVIFKRKGYTASDEVIQRLQSHWTETLLPSQQGIVMVKCNKKTYDITQVPLITPDMAFVE